MATTSISQNQINSAALKALVAYHLHTIGKDARFEDFTQNAAESLWERVFEHPIVAGVNKYNKYVNGLVEGFEIGIKAAAAIASSPLTSHIDDMREVVALAVECVRSNHDDCNAETA